MNQRPREILLCDVFSHSPSLTSNMLKHPSNLHQEGNDSSHSSSSSKIKSTIAVFVSVAVLGFLFLSLLALREPFIDEEDPVFNVEGLDVILPKHDNHRPVVGILTQPAEDGTEYIAASYVKYAEAAGARVVPIRFGWSEKQLKQAFKGLNGILFPGGGASIDPKNSKIYRAASVLYAEAERSNRVGRRFPIWGTCLGWELLATLEADYTILTESGMFLDPSGSSRIQNVDHSSKMFKGIPRKLVRTINNGQKLFYFSHEYGVTPEMFQRKLDRRCWKATALGQDKLGKHFIAAAESKCRPYYGVQFHPEKSLFEWYSKVSMPHSFAATEISRHFISVLGEELRWSRPGSWKDSEVFARDIHHYSVVSNGDSYFYQAYVFPNDSKTKPAAVAWEPLEFEDAESEGHDLSR